MNVNISMVRIRTLCDELVKAGLMHPEFTNLEVMFAYLCAAADIVANTCDMDAGQGARLCDAMEKLAPQLARGAMEIALSDHEWRVQ